MTDANSVPRWAGLVKIQTLISTSTCEDEISLIFQFDTEADRNNMTTKAGKETSEWGEFLSE